MPAKAGGIKFARTIRWCAKSQKLDAGNLLHFITFNFGFLALIQINKKTRPNKWPGFLIIVFIY